jgi:hypothetical protein
MLDEIEKITNYKHQISNKSQYPITETRFQFPGGVAIKHWIYNRVANFKSQTTLLN